MKEALVILPGITADSAKRTFVLDYFARHTSFEVLLPPLWQSFGIRGAAGQLRRFLDKLGPYDRIHFLAYISGGFILRAAMMADRLPLGNIVYVRAPVQEEVPPRFIRHRGRLVAALCWGRMLFDLSSDGKDELPYPCTPGVQGLVIEHGISRLAGKLGLQAQDFIRLRYSARFKIPVVKDTWEARESHDDVYTSAALLARIAQFLTTDTFQGSHRTQEN